MSSGECSYWPVRAAALTGFARTVDHLSPGCCRVGGAHRHNSLQSGKPNGEEDSQISFFFRLGYLIGDWPSENSKPLNFHSKQSYSSWRRWLLDRVLPVCEVRDDSLTDKLRGLDLDSWRRLELSKIVAKQAEEGKELLTV
ncbi:Hypothetical predicted protein [Olea europaea subsp. europaea]|uniref:Uncharacterized protein n=1 Tax=Olea europaea subsp. europaea TaxID=158383 RepID=A0A8S0SD16_OLEEU|nr:Hypothetical predicted protein [Olea europaea subsp. europaea]